MNKRIQKKLDKRWGIKSYRECQLISDITVALSREIEKVKSSFLRELTQINPK